MKILAAITLASLFLAIFSWGATFRLSAVHCDLMDRYDEALHEQAALRESIVQRDRVIAVYEEALHGVGYAALPEVK